MIYTSVLKLHHCPHCLYGITWWWGFISQRDMVVFWKGGGDWRDSRDERRWAKWQHWKKYVHVTWAEILVTIAVATSKVILNWWRQSFRTLHRLCSWRCGWRWWRVIAVSSGDGRWWNWNEIGMYREQTNHGMKDISIQICWIRHCDEVISLMTMWM